MDNLKRKRQIFLSSLMVWGVVVGMYVTIKIQHHIHRRDPLHDAIGILVDDESTDGHADSNAGSRSVTIREADLQLSRDKINSGASTDEKHTAIVQLSDCLYLRKSASNSDLQMLVDNMPDDKRSSGPLTVIINNGNPSIAARLVDKAINFKDPQAFRASIQTAYFLDKKGVGEKITGLVASDPANARLMNVIKEMGYGH